ncbi:MAG: NAD-dependent epimerase/dehydratase family protein [Fimbriimonadaceae bacterium]|nr:NAD-dependent epimerase/dehydratase family protein [Fimbriimonadaceae bacterium]
MRLLVLGGTVFLGRHIVEAALADGHEVTLFHRGERGGDLFSGQVERILGDRTKDLDRLAGQKWDIAIDTCGYLPGVVRQSAEALKDSVGAYLFISTISVYDDPEPGSDEGAALAPIKDPNATEVNGETYGYLKVLCEQAVQEVYPDRFLLVRPGLIVGPWDPTDRFTYWPTRIERGENVLAAGKDQPTQFVDVRDLAAYCVQRLSALAAGNLQDRIVHVVGPHDSISIGEVVDTCCAELRPEAKVYWVTDEFLAQHEVKPWSDLPLYVGSEGLGMMQLNHSRAIKTGLTFRPLAETVRDTANWAREHRAEVPLKAGLAADRELELLEQWWS